MNKIPNEWRFPDFEDWLESLTKEQLAVADYLAGSPRAMYDRLREVMEKLQKRG